MLVNILFAIVVLFVIVINFIFFFTTSGKQMIVEIEDQCLLGKIGLIIIYFPALSVRFFVNLFNKSYRKHKSIYKFICELVAVFLVFISVFVVYLLLYGFGF
jgi:hypothetical protein